MECCGTVQPVGKEHELPASRRNASLESLVNDAVLADIKKQSTGGCFLCAMDEWAEEDWE